MLPKLSKFTVNKSVEGQIKELINYISNNLVPALDRVLNNHQNYVSKIVVEGNILTVTYSNGTQNKYVISKGEEEDG